MCQPHLWEHVVSVSNKTGAREPKASDCDILCFPKSFVVRCGYRDYGALLVIHDIFLERYVTGYRR